MVDDEVRSWVVRTSGYGGTVASKMMMMIAAATVATVMVVGGSRSRIGIGVGCGSGDGGGIVRDAAALLLLWLRL